MNNVRMSAPRKKRIFEIGPVLPKNGANYCQKRIILTYLGAINAVIHTVLEQYLTDFKNSFFSMCGYVNVIRVNIFGFLSNKTKKLLNYSSKHCYLTTATQHIYLKTSIFLDLSVFF
jgi:hypothetical protein